MASLRFRGNTVLMRHVDHVILQVLSVHFYQPHADNADNADDSREPKEVTSQQPVISRSSSVKENDPLVGLPSEVKEIITV